MENIQCILNKLNNFSTQKTNYATIDLDLMLDYTRKLYDVLLSTKEEILSAPFPTNESAHEETTSADSIESTENDVNTQAEQTLTEKEVAKNTEPNIAAEDIRPKEQQEQEPVENDTNVIHPAFSEETNTTIATEETKTTGSENQEVEASEIDTNREQETTIREPINEGNPSPEDAEQKLKNNLYPVRSNISYEPPHSAEEEPFYPEEGIEEDVPEENDTPIQEIPVPLPEENDEFPDYANIFNYASQAAAEEKTDIRKKIGINDKYLFLNELFNSQKKNYEDTLDKINEMPDYHQALEWVKKEIAPMYKWYDDDETVQGFYDVLSIHFSAR